MAVGLTVCGVPSPASWGGVQVLVVVGGGFLVLYLLELEELLEFLSLLLLLGICIRVLVSDVYYYLVHLLLLLLLLLL